MQEARTHADRVLLTCDGRGIQAKGRALDALILAVQREERERIVQALRNPDTENRSARFWGSQFADFLESQEGL